VYQRVESPEPLFGHIFGEDSGFLVTFTGQQARLKRAAARHNELAAIRQQSFRYPDEADQASTHLLAESERGRDAYVGVHLFRKSGTRLAADTVPTVRSLWLDEDEGTYPEIGPEPTAVVASSARCRHLYWRLTKQVSVEWAVAMNRRLACWAGGDVGKAGLATVLRVPGTMNYKRHPQVDPVALQITRASPWDPEVMEQAIPPLPEPSKVASTTEPYDGPELELEELLTGVEIIGEVADGLGRKLAIVCPWADEHGGGDLSGTYLGQRSGGGLWFYCNHAHCHGRTLADFRTAVCSKIVRISRPAEGPKNNERTVKITRG